MQFFIRRTLNKYQISEVQSIKQNPQSEPRGAPQLVTHAKKIRQVKAWDSAEH